MLQHSQPGECPLLQAWTPPPPTPLISSITTQHTGTLLHMMSVGLLHESKQKNPHGHWCFVAEERVASPSNSTAGVHFRKEALESVPLNTIQVCTYARRKPFTRYKLKATFIAANWEQLSGGNTNKLSKVRHWEARVSLIIIDFASG